MWTRLTAVIALLAVPACSSTHFVSSTNGYFRLDRPELSAPYKIYIAEDLAAENAFLEAEITNYTRQILADQGFAVVRDTAEADLLVSLAYGVGNPRQVSTVRPVYVPGETTTIKSASGATLGSAESPASVGYVSASRTVHDRWLTVVAYDYPHYAEAGELVEVWRGETTSSGSSGDLRYVLPYMLVPTLRHFGRNTGRAVKASVNVGDPRVETLVSQGE